MDKIISSANYPVTTTSGTTYWIPSNEPDKKKDRKMHEYNIYSVAVLKHPTEKEFEEGKRTEILVAPSIYIAESREKAKLMLARNLPIEVDVGDVDFVVLEYS